VATNCVSVHRIYIALEPSLDGKEPTAFKAVVLSLSDVQAWREYGFYCIPQLISVQGAKGGMIVLGISKHEATYG